jgi:hypothetical protein
LCQRDLYNQTPSADGYFSVGCVTRIALLQDVDIAITASALGLARVRIRELRVDGEFATATFDSIEMPPSRPIDETSLVKLRSVAETVCGAVDPAHDAGMLADQIAAHLALDPVATQWFLETFDVKARVGRLLDPEQLAWEDAKAMDADAERSSIIRRLFARNRR